MDIFGQPSLILLFALTASAVAFLLVNGLFQIENSRHQVIQWTIAVSHQSNQIFFLLFGTYIIVFGTLAAIRFMTFHTGYHDLDTSWDLGLFDQSVWNSLHGRLLQNSFIPDAPNYLGKSFSPLLIALVPLYSIWASPIMLLIIQVVALGLVAFPVYWYAQLNIGSVWAVVLALSFFLFPGVQNITLNEFHDIALEAPLLAFAAFFLLRRRYVPFLISLGVAMLAKEEVAVIGLGLGLYILLVQRNWKLGLALVLFCIILSASLLQIIIPYFRGSEFGTGFYYFSSGQTGGGGGRYSYLGKSLPEISLTLLTRPDIVISKMIDPLKMKYLMDLLVPLALVPLIGIEVSAFALPTLAYSLLSTYPLQYSIKFYYFAPLVPFLFFGAILGIQRTRDWGIRVLGTGDLLTKKYAVNISLATLVLTASIVTYFLQSPGPFGGDFQAWRYEFNDHAALGQRLIALVPLNQTVIAQNEYLAHLSHAPKIYEVPLPDYRDVDYAFADSHAGWYAVHAGHWEVLRRTGFFETVAEQDGYWLGKRIAPQQSFLINFRDELTALGYALPITSSIQGGNVIRPVVFWRAEKSLATRYGMRIAVVDAQNHLWAEQEVEPHDGTLPTNRWERGKVIADQYALRLPPTMPAGEYQLVVGVHSIDDENFLEATDPARGVLGNQPTLARLRVEKNKGSFVASDLVKEQPLNELFVDMGEMRFLGYYPFQDTIHRGDVLPIGLYWRARAKPRGDYLVSVQLRDANNRVAFEQSARPAANTYPTPNWDEGEVLLDWHDLALPRDLLLGQYRVATVLRDAATGATIGETLISSISVIN